MTTSLRVERFRRLVLLPLRRRFARIAQVSHHGLTLAVDTRDEMLGHDLYVGRGWEPYLSALFPLLNIKGKVAVDIGANIGVHTIELSISAGKSGRVLAFEPESNALELLRRNLQLNGAENVTVERVALGDRRGRARLARSSWNFGDHRVLTENESSSEQMQEVSIEILDDFCLPLGPNAVGLIKIDVQGYEGHVLRGAEATLDANPDVWLIVEIPQVGSRQLTPTPEIVRWLVERGFRGVELHSSRVIPLLEPEEYSTFLDNEIHLLLSRNEGRLRDLVAVYRAAQVKSRGLSTSSLARDTESS